MSRLKVMSLNARVLRKRKPQRKFGAKTVWINMGINVLGQRFDCLT